MDEAAGPEGPQTSSNPAMIPKEPADLVPAASVASAPVKMRERPRRGLPRPSGYDIVNNSFSKENRTSADESPKVSPASVASNSPGLFQRNMKFFLSFNKKQRRRSSSNSNFSAIKAFCVIEYRPISKRRKNLFFTPTHYVFSKTQGTVKLNNITYDVGGIQSGISRAWIIKTITIS